MPGSSRSANRKPKGIAIRPEAVRQARIEKGLSLAEVAGREITRAAVHLVEAGKMRPSMRTLQLIAQRTGRPVSFFIAGAEGSAEHRAARDELSHLVDTGAFHEAIAHGTHLLLEELEPGIEADVRFSVGRAHVRLIESERALTHLARARELYARLGDAWMAVHVQEQEAVAMFLIEDPRTMSRTLDALERCDRLDPPAPTLRASILNVLGNIHMRERDWANAARFFEMGLEACDGVVSMREAARLHDGLSWARQQLGDFAGALRSAERAFALYSVDTDAMALARAENNLGYVLLRQGELNAAAPHLLRALDLCDRHGVQRRCRAEVLNSLGELHLERGQPDQAQVHLLRALEVATELKEGDAEATARHLLGRVHLRLGDEAAADRSFRAAIELLKRLDLTERLRQCAAEYADLLHRQGRLEESIACWRIAAGAAGTVAPTVTRTNGRVASRGATSA
ncbi:MAG TPA: helix-turn-helix transcriptional regulator [Candidatus Dormibacteraeota bacterium]